MRFLIQTVLVLACALSTRADQLQFADVVKPSLVFRDDSNPAKPYPHVLKVFLRHENIRDGEVTWVADAVTGIEAELLDSNGKPVSQPPTAASIQSSPKPFNLPYGSNLEWLISHGGVSIIADTANTYALFIGGQGWLIPIETASSYTLRIRLHGHPWTSTTLREGLEQPKLLLELPPTKLKITE